jgi:hypothetical protein
MLGFCFHQKQIKINKKRNKKITKSVEN